MLSAGSAERTSEWERPGMRSASESRGEEEMEVRVLSWDGRMRVTVVGEMCEVRFGQTMVVDGDAETLDVERLAVA